MANEFYGFGQLTRPDIGLLADNVQNLAEIYTSDQPDALRNISLTPEVLDIIHEVSETIGAEDLRATSDLSTLLLTTLHLQFETLERIEENIFYDGIYASTLDRIGVDSSNTSLTGNQARAEHSIIFNGAIQCYGAKYRENKIDEGQNLFTAKTVNSFLSTSRASLLSSELDDSGHFASAEFPGSIRVRKRSHVNTIKVNPLSFTPAPAVVEQPSKRIRCNIKNGSTEIPAWLLATANSPLKIPCALNKGKIIFKFNTSSVQSFYGVQIQPQTSKPGSPPIFLAQDPQPQNQIKPGNFDLTHTVNIDISATGYQDTYDLYMYLYVNPEAVTSITFQGIEIKDFFDKKDFGLIGFKNLENFSFLINNPGGRSSSFTILPIWLKTLDNKLKTFDIANTGDVWAAKSQMKWFDYRKNNIVSAAFANLPYYTMSGYLSIPKRGVTVNILGDGFNGGETEKFAKYIQSAVPSGADIPTSGGAKASGWYRTPGAEFREFDAMKTLNLGSRVYGYNARLDDVFPQLTSLTWTGHKYRVPLIGTPPKISNHGGQIDVYNISQNSFLSSVSIYDIGTAAANASVDKNSTGTNSLCHISKYNIKSFNISGRTGRHSKISGCIGGRPGQETATSSPLTESEWATWYTNTTTVNLGHCDNLEFNFQPAADHWKLLTTLGTRHTKVYFRAATGITASPFKMPRVGSIDLDYAQVQSGVLPSMKKSTTGSDFVNFRIEGIKNLTLFTERGESYLFPQDFATEGGSSGYLLSRIEAHHTTSYAPAHGVRMRKGMFDECPELSTIVLSDSNFTGEFVNIPPRPNTDEPEGEKEINVSIYEADFHSLTNLSINGSSGHLARDLKSLIAHNQNKSQGGCLLPDYQGAANSKIQSVHLNNNLPTTYPSSWEIGSYASGDIIEDSHASTTLSGMDYHKVPNTGDEFYYLSLSGSSNPNLKRKVLVNDKIEIGGKTATVMSVYNDRVYVDKDLALPSSGNTITFVRSTKDIGTWFQEGFSKLQYFRAANCRLSGTLNIRANLKLKNAPSTNALELSTNNIGGVTEGTWKKIFSGGNRALTVNLAMNNLNVDTIRASIRTLYEIAGTTGWSRGKVILSGNKKVNRRYQSWSQNELFPVGTKNLPDQEINLTRREEIKVYRTVTTVDEDGNETTSRVQEGTRFVVVPGKKVGTEYFGKKTLSRTGSSENELGLKFRRMRLVISLGFTYRVPPSGSTVTGETLGDSYGTGDTGRLASAQVALGSSFALSDFADS